MLAGTSQSLPPQTNPAGYSLYLLPAEVDSWPPPVLHRVRACLGRLESRLDGEVSVDGLLQQLRDGEIDMWAVGLSPNPVFAAAIICTGELTGDNGERIFVVGHAGGWEVRHWVAMGAAALESLAKERGCVSIRLTGRTGWQKLLPPDWKLVSVVLEKKV